jgi:hypothetical protein
VGPSLCRMAADDVFGRARAARTERRTAMHLHLALLSYSFACAAVGEPVVAFVLILAVACCSAIAALLSADRSAWGAVGGALLAAVAAIAAVVAGTATARAHDGAVDSTGDTGSSDSQRTARLIRSSH